MTSSTAARGSFDTDIVKDDTIWRITVGKEYWTSKNWEKYWGMYAQKDAPQIPGEDPEKFVARTAKIRFPGVTAASRTISLEKDGNKIMNAWQEECQTINKTKQKKKFPEGEGASGPEIEARRPRVPREQTPTTVRKTHHDLKIGNPHALSSALPDPPQRIPLVEDAEEVSLRRVKAGLSLPPQYVPDKALKDHMHDYIKVINAESRLNIGRGRGYSAEWLEDDGKKKSKNRARCASSQSNAPAQDDSGRMQTSRSAPGALPERSQSSAAATMPNGSKAFPQLDMSSRYEGYVSPFQIRGPDFERLTLEQKQQLMYPREKYSFPQTAAMTHGWRVQCSPAVAMRHPGSFGLELFGVKDHAYKRSRNLMSVYQGEPNHPDLLNVIWRKQAQL